MKKICLHTLFLSLLLVVMACNEAPYEQEPTIDLQYLADEWSLVSYETSTPSGGGAIVTTTQLDGAMSFTFNVDETMLVTNNNIVQAHATYSLSEADNTLKLIEYEFVDDVEPEGIAVILLPIVVNNTLQIEELTSDKLTLSMPYSGDTRFIAYFVNR